MVWSPTFAYDAAGNVIRETNGEGETTHTFYDAEGRTISALDGNGDETRYRYDSEGNLTLIIDAEQNVTALHLRRPESARRPKRLLR